MIDESSKLNLNALVAAEKKQQSSTSLTTSTSGMTSTGTNSSSSGASTVETSTVTVSAADPASRLLMIPGMTYELADAILDFIDDDEISRTNGCESEYYNGLQPSYSSKNSPLESLDELLLGARRVSRVFVR